MDGTVLWPLSSGSCSAICTSSTLCLGTDGGQTNTGPDVRRHHPGQDDLCLAVWKRPATERAEPEAARAGAASASASLGGSCCCSYRWGRLGWCSPCAMFRNPIQSERCGLARSVPSGCEATIFRLCQPSRWALTTSEFAQPSGGSWVFPESRVLSLDSGSRTGPDEVERAVGPHVPWAATDMRLIANDDAQSWGHVNGRAST